MPTAEVTITTPPSEPPRSFVWPPPMFPRKPVDGGRRGLLLGAGLAAFAASLVVPVLAIASPTEGISSIDTLGADAELIALCAEYIRRTKDYDTVDTGLESDDDPRWPLLIGAEKRALSLEAQTLQGVLAKAQVALFSAQMVDGSEDFDTGYTGDWPEQVVRDLLRLYGSAVA